jgi:uncharacterized membrane protein
MPSRYWELFGKLHVVVVHFPVALLLVAAALELFAMLRRRGNSPTARTCLYLGTMGALAAVAMGWVDARFMTFAGDEAKALLWHRWLGVAVAALAVVMSIIAVLPKTPTRTYRIGLLITALIVGIAGHFGGSLVHGSDFLALSPVESSTLSTTATTTAGLKIDAGTIAFPADGKIDFARHVQPILVQDCVSCHGTGVKRGALRLDAKKLAFSGGNSGPAIIAGDPDKSPLLRRVLGLDQKARMPMDHPPLSDVQTKILSAWIAQGANWPEQTGAEPVADQKHWAYVAPIRPALPKVDDPAHWARNPIDSFILARLNKEGLHPSPEADRATLLRRVSLDLVGLPPTPEQADAFLSDNSADAYDKLVDRLLASPHYGERWARPWLDLARYADSNGYEKDRPRSMWPYRDWVINALNADMPFDEFTIEQLAGDLLPNATLDQKIATGFQRNTMINQEGGVDPEEYRYYAIIDRVNTTASTWLGSTINCCQCHDHKYDPFSQKEYYQLLAFYNSTATETRMQGFDPTDVSPRIEIPSPRREQLLKQIAELQARLKAPATSASTAPTTQKIEPDPLVAQIADLKKQAEAARITTLVMRELDTPRETNIHVRGAFLTVADKVEPGTPAVLNAFAPSLPRNRLGLAKWIVDPANPLTARVQVNRIWEQYFGRGIVGTSEDFGTRGDAPTHPELLDYLATELVRDKWSLKAIHRLIVTSATYRQQSKVSPEMLEKDPYNTLLARGPRFRLDAEMIRDQALAVSNLLSPKIGGPSVYPYQPDGIWNVVYSGSQWMTSTGGDQYRRGLYTFWRRSSPYPAFISFDATSREVTCTRRSRTNTPLQAMTTLNDPAFVQPAAALARLIVRDGGGSPGDKVIYAFRRTLVRLPTAEEMGRLVQLYRQVSDQFHTDPGAAAKLAAGGLSEPLPANVDPVELASWTAVSNVLLNLDEALTKE